MGREGKSYASFQEILKLFEDAIRAEGWKLLLAPECHVATAGHGSEPADLETSSLVQSGATTVATAYILEAQEAEDPPKSSEQAGAEVSLEVDWPRAHQQESAHLAKAQSRRALLGPTHRCNDKDCFQSSCPDCRAWSHQRGRH